jgi:sulfhydrogenase subunit delta
MPQDKPKLAVFKFTSCDGCQVALLNLEDELLDLASCLTFACFHEATSTEIEPPYDVTLIEGSITTASDRERLRRIREQSKYLVALGACATSGGIQSLRNWAELGDYRDAVYPPNADLDSLSDSTPVSAHVPVDLELHGCPINSQQLLHVITCLLHDRQPHLPAHAVCVECKRRGSTCVLVSRGLPCLGPLTRAGCGAICPRMSRGCYGCFGPMENANPESLVAQFRRQGIPADTILRLLRGFTAGSDAFLAASRRLEAGTR